MRNILFILAALFGIGAFGQTNVPTRQMLADTNGLVKWPPNITGITIGGKTFTNLTGFGLSLSNGQLSVDTTQLPEGSGGSSLVTSVAEDFEVTGGELAITNAIGTGPLLRQSEAGSGGLTGIVAVASGGTGATNAATARSNLGVLSSRWLTGFGTPVDYSEGTGSYYVDLNTYQVWEQTDESTWQTIPFFVMGEGVYSYLSLNNRFAGTNTFDAPVVLNAGISGNGSLLTSLDDDSVAFDDADSLWTATAIGPALEELNDSINAGVPNGTGAKLHWSQLLGVPAGFADGSDDGSGGGSGTMTGIAFVVPSPFGITPASTTTTNTFTLSVSNQTANTVYAGPSSGGASVPAFRSLVDDDVPNTITIDLATTATTANSGDSATAFFSSGEIEDARLPSGLARDSEVAAGYQPLDADLTAMAAGTAVATAQTNAVSLGAPVLYVGTTNVAEALAAGGGGGGLSDGGTAASLTVTNLTSDSITYRNRWLFDPLNGDVWADGTFLALNSAFAFYPYSYGALASGTLTVDTGTAEHPYLQIVRSSASANSGGAHFLNAFSYLLAGSEMSVNILKVSNTNAVVGRFGFHDATTTTDESDGCYIEMAEGFFVGKTASNNSRTSTVSSNQVVLNTWYTFEIELDSSASQVVFRQFNDSGTLLWSDTNTVNIPTGSSRWTAHGILFYYVTGGAQDLAVYDAMGVGFKRKLTRKP